LGLDIHHIKLPENTFPIETDSALISISAGAQGYNIVYMLYTATGGEVVTSLDDAQQDNETHIMPHPLTHQSQIMLNPAFGSAHIHIYDLSGRIAAQYYNVMDYITIQKSDFQPGMYMVRVNQGTHTTIKKLLVE
ncbi:MAG TPA: T9SS type A sorting domain-containing protein, partial [Cytophagales bacterium]|nr:T9SS type A sorting domain-containing protein [Cytophagales bacterium]